MATVDDKKVIFSMVGVSKTIQQNQKQVLKNIYLSFFYGAKIGIIGLNGAGKSTLMKIIAGLDQQYQGNVVWSPGYTVGYLPQDPPLNEEKTVKENVMEGVQHVYDALAEYDDINVKFGLPEYYEDPDKMDKLMARQAELQDVIDSTDAWNMDSKLDRAMAALNCPPGDWSVKNLSSIVAKVFPGRVTTHHGSSRSHSVWLWRRRLPQSVVRPSSASWSGFAWLPRPDMPRERPV